jgi:hypothetical protein
MPLYRRRRSRKASEVPPSLPTTALHPVGQSPLEILPLEILLNIFLESQNTEFVRISKTIYAMLGEKPSDWLLFEFFIYGHEYKGA